jgi:hypothetical protein
MVASYVQDHALENPETKNGLVKEIFFNNLRSKYVWSPVAKTLSHRIIDLKTQYIRRMMNIACFIYLHT